MEIILGDEFDTYWKDKQSRSEDEETEKTVKEIIRAVRESGDKAVRRFALMFDKSSPENLEVSLHKVKEAVRDLEASDPKLAGALRFSVENIRRFSLAQREQFRDFEIENVPGVFAGQRVIPIERAGVYIPGGRFPLISSALMCLIPAFCAGVEDICLSSPPGSDGLPDKRILAASGLAAEVCGRLKTGGFRVFSVGGAQAVAALALGTETIPRCDVVAGPGNKYVAAAKRILYGEAGIDLIAGPSDILVIMEENSSADLAAADMLAQAEHDVDARARALVPSRAAADLLVSTLDARLQKLAASNAGEVSCSAPPIRMRAVSLGSDVPLGTSSDAPLGASQASLDAGGLIIIYKNMEEALRIANAIAPEHLELQVSDSASWIPGLKNYGSLFIGALSAEVLGDYSSGLNHTLPTSGSARFTGGLSIRHFLKTLSTLRCEKGSGYRSALEAAETIAQAEGLRCHAESAKTAFRKD